MKRPLAFLALSIAVAALSGCYYDPGYSYVRGAGYGGDAYYGSGTTYYPAPAYYDGYYPGYYGGYYGCCYAPGVSIGISGRWYGGSRHRDYRRYDGPAGHGYRGQGQSRGGSAGGAGHRAANPPHRHRGRP